MLIAVQSEFTAVQRELSSTRQDTTKRKPEFAPPPSVHRIVPGGTGGTEIRSDGLAPAEYRLATREFRELQRSAEKGMKYAIEFVFTARNGNSRLYRVASFFHHGRPSER